MITSDKCIALIREALRKFGEYSYWDKGAVEVMDMDVIVEEFKDMTAQQIADVLNEVHLYEQGDPFVQCVLISLQGEPNMDALYEDSRLAELA